MCFLIFFLVVFLNPEECVHVTYTVCIVYPYTFDITFGFEIHISESIYLPTSVHHLFEHMRIKD